MADNSLFISSKLANFAVQIKTITDNELKLLKRHIKKSVSLFT